MEDIIAIVMTKKTEEDICIKADEARKFCASKLSEICRQFMKEANCMIKTAASNGQTRILFPSRNYTEAVAIFCSNWLKELGYTIERYSDRIIIKW